VEKHRDDRLYGAGYEYRREIIMVDLPTGLAGGED